MFLKTTDMIYIKIVSNLCDIRIVDIGSVMDEKWSFLYERFFTIHAKNKTSRQANDQGNVIIVH